MTDLPPNDTLEPALLTQVAIVPTATLPSDTFIVGESVGGRAILARRIGSGGRVLLLVGGIHGGFEANTVVLVNELISHFAANPEDVMPGVSLVLVPVANPDGLLRGRTPEGRFNANGIDLNRNWGCDWAAEAFWQHNKVNPGERAFSEPETQALARLVRELQAGAVLFYHSAAGGVFGGSCYGDHGSQALAEVLGDAAGYPSDGDFDAYTVTGDAADWVDGQGIPAVDVELLSWRDSEFERNLRGVMAVQCWLVGQEC